MIEAPLSTELQEQQHRLSDELNRLGIEFPQDPDLNENSPRPWLVRGSHNKGILTNGDKFLIPHDGQMGSTGVFFGDCLRPLMYPHTGVFYVFLTTEVATDWLSTSTDRYQAILKHIADEKRLDTRTISGGIDTEAEVYAHYNVYQAHSGIAAAASPVPLYQARHILVTPDLLYPHELERIPSLIKDKIQELPQL